MCSDYRIEKENGHKKAQKAQKENRRQRSEDRRALRQDNRINRDQILNRVYPVDPVKNAFCLVSSFVPFVLFCGHSVFLEERSVNHEDYMRRAVSIAEQGIAAGQSPFGAVIVRNGAVVSEAHNTVWLTCDPTAHAEVGAIRKAAAALRTINLSGCEMYTTCEPCPMCLAATHWSKIDVVYYGATIADAQAAGFCELCVGAKILAEMGGSPLRVETGPLQPECVALFTKWKTAALGKPY